LGIYTYQQIMDWDAAAIAEFSKLLGDNKLMERDDWIGQSARMHQELYGRAA
jgi:predicted flap endonuclease-1-like 5' DNA nuclease